MANQRFPEVDRPRLSEKATRLRRKVSPVREIMRFADPEYLQSIGVQAEGLISFAGGWVNHESPAELQEAYLEVLASPGDFHHSGSYSATLGTPAARAAVVQFERELYGMSDLASSQVVIGQSSTQLALDLFHVLLDPGDGILLLDPSYCNYPTQLLSSIPDVQLHRFSVIQDEPWAYDADSRIAALRSSILEHRPRVVLLVVPDNPTSQVLSDSFVRAALDAVREVGGFLLIDFAYKEIVFSDRLPEYFSWGPSDNYLSLHSNSKWCRGLGRRLGWIEAPEFICAALESISNSSILCPDTLHQMAFARYVEKAAADGSLVGYVGQMRRKYEAAADHSVAAIDRHLGLPRLTPQGGLYTCVKVGSNSAQYVEDVLKETGVLFVPGWGFGRTLTEAVRISYGPLVNDLDLIDEGLRRVGTLCLSR